MIRLCCRRTCPILLSALLPALLSACSDPPAAESADSSAPQTASDSPDPQATQRSLTRGPASEQPPRFLEQAAELGVEHVYENGLSERFHIVETIGGGVAILDYDLDGDLDLYLPQGGNPHQQPAHPAGDRLLRNQLLETGEFVFSDVSAEAGIAQTAYAIGVTVGDPNGDGLPDLYLSNFGPNALLINLGDGRFAQQAEVLGVADPGMSTGALFFDFDQDGDQDLLVANYVQGEPEPKPCWGRDSLRDYCSPKSWQPAANHLYRNDGGVFVDATQELACRRIHARPFKCCP